LLLASAQAAACGGSGNGGSSSTPEGGTEGGAEAGLDSGGHDATASDGGGDGASDGSMEASGPPSACAQLTVPLSNSDGANTDFMILLPATSGVDLTGATLEVQLYAPHAASGVVIPYVQQGSANNYAQNFLTTSGVPLTTASSWTTLSFPVVGTTTNIARIGLSIQSGSNGNADAGLTFEQPATIIYVGSITITGASTPVGPFVFDMASTVAPAPSSYPTDQLWLNTDDKPVAGSSVVFDPTCGTPVDAGTSMEAGSEEGGSDSGGSDSGGSDSASSDAGVSDGSSDAASEASDGATASCPPGLGDAGGGGCAVLSVPLSGSGQKAWFDIDVPTTDFTGATITAQVIAPAATAGVLQAFVQAGADGGYALDFLGWKNLTGATSWTTLSWTVSNADTQEQRLGLSLESGGVTDASVFEQPATVVYINQITVTLGGASTSTPVGPWTFPSASSISASQYANVLWLDTSDSPLAGSSLTWLP
jgi:hypothetical protein